MENLKKYKVIIPYSESSTPSKTFKIEYDIEAADNASALHKAENMFNSYFDSTSASWVRTINRGGIRVWRVVEGLPQTPAEIDELCQRLINSEDNEGLKGALKQLALLEDARTTSYILKQTKHEELDIAMMALEALESIADPTSLTAVKSLYKEDSPIELKVRIISAISRIALPEDDILEFMSALLDDKSRSVQTAAEKAFDRLEARAIASGWVEWLRARQKRGFKKD